MAITNDMHHALKELNYYASKYILCQNINRTAFMSFKYDMECLSMKFSVVSPHHSLSSVW